MAREYFCLSLLMFVMYLDTKCMAENRWLSRPSQTTAVKEGSNVTLTWRYVLSNKPERITFGLWESSYIKRKLLVVTQYGHTMVNSLVKGRMFFEGTLSNPGYASIKILAASLQDSKAYGFEISTGLQRSSFEHSFELLVYNQTSKLSPTTPIKSEETMQSSMKSFFGRFMTHILILVCITIFVACGICLCVAVLRRQRKKTRGKTSRTKKRKTNRKQRRTRNVMTSQMMYKEASTLTVDEESDEVPEELTPFRKFEVSCTLHDNNVLPTMKTFGQRNNSVKSSITNQVPTDEGGVHIYQEIDGAQGPALSPRNSIKKKQESMGRNKSSTTEKNTRSSKKYGKENSKDGKACTTIERVDNEHKRRITDQRRCQTNDNDSSRRVSGKLSRSTSSSMSGPSESDWEVTPESVHMCHRIGAGSFGQVWKGILEGKQVAVKMLNERPTRSDKKDLLSELEVMKTLKPHPNVVKLKGCITRANVTCSGSVFDPPLVFLELVQYGDLLGYLRKSRGEDDDYYNDQDLKCPERPTPQHLFSFAHDVAKGMAFLAENKIVHRDLAARNVLIGDRLRCKITDFGMARTLHNEDIYTKRSNGLFPVKWMAIESLLFQRYTTYSDVWSYGVVLYEIFTLGGRPYAGMNGLEVVEMIKNGKRLPKPPHVYSKLYSLMLQCWSKNPNYRPDFASLCKQITLLAKDHQKYLNLKEYDHRPYVNVPSLKGK